MSNETNTETILDEALQLKTGPERQAYLKKACADNEGLLRKVEDMLEAHQRAGEFLKHLEMLVSPDDIDETGKTIEIDLSEQVASVIGRYKLLEKIGEGGMGVVYMAEQTEPVTRKVALKIIKLGMDTKQVVARFEAERQALAMMDHPNIARVLDGGATDTGRPYFVMELVRGVPITEYCDQNKLSAKERIELFLPVCQALQSAHQKGIIHRDIKPSNVMVSILHDEPIAKVIDFGIAKATNQKLTEKTLFTNYSVMIGTPAYMSPEQAQMSVLDVDTRTDIYSLGVLLYELLTGTTPFPERRLRSAGYAEMQRIIAEEDPEKPSTRLSKTRAASIVEGKGGKSNIRFLDSEIDSDLDWVTMKCLEKDRRRRYETTNDLATDLKRHLNNEPVSAVAPTFSYQFRKLCAKHKGFVRAVAAISGTLIVATLVSGYLAIRMNGLRRDAEQLREAETILRADAETERDRATNAEKDVLRRSIELENHLYVSDMLAVEQAVASEELGFARDLLDRHRQEPSGNDLRGFEWRYFHERSKGDQIEEFQAHTGSIREMNLSPDGRLLVTIGQDDKTKLWQRSPHKLLHEWASGIVAISSDWRRMATVGSDGKARLWELPSAAQLHVWNHHPGAVRSLTFSHDSRFLTAVVQPDPDNPSETEVTFWNLDSKELHWSLSGKWWKVKVAMSPTEPIVATRGWALDAPKPGDTAVPSFPIQLWNYETKKTIGTPLKREEPDNLGMSDMKFSSTGQFIDSGLPIHIWNVSTQELVTNLPRETSFSVFSFSADDRFFATKGQRRNSVQVWETATGRLVNAVSHESSVTEALFHPVLRDHLVTCSTDQTLRIWNWKESQLVTRLLGQASDIMAMTVEPAGRIAFSGGQNGSVMAWGLDTSPSMDKITNGYTLIPPIFSSKGQLMVIAEFIGEQNITYLDLAIPSNMQPGPKGTPPPAFRPEIPWRQVVYDPSDCNRLWVIDVSEQMLGFTPDEEILLTITPNRVIYRNARSGDLIRSMVLDPPIANWNFNIRGTSRRFALSPDGTQLAAIEDYVGIRLIDLSSGATLATLEENAWLRHIEFSPAADKIVFRSRSVAGIWDLDRDAIHRLTEGVSWEVKNFDVAPDNLTAVASCTDNALRVWRMQTGELIHTIQGFRDLATQVSFSADGKTLATLHSSSPQVRFWNTRTWRVIAGFKYDTRPRGVQFSPDNRTLITSHFPTGAKLWRAPLLEKSVP